SILRNYQLLLKNSTRSDIAMTNNVISLKYAEVPMITQGFASSSISVNPFNVCVFTGLLQLSPPSDFWIDTTVQADVVTNNNGENDHFTTNLVSPVVPTVDENPRRAIDLPEDNDLVSYQLTNNIAILNHDGVSLLDAVPLNPTPNNNLTSAPSLSSGLTGAVANAGGNKAHQTSPAFNNNTKSTATAVVNTSLIPFIRNLPITWAATGMKPNTQIYTFFDG